MDGRHAAAAEPGAGGGGGDADRRQNTTVALGASLLGAIVTFLYFRYVDVGTSAPRPGPGELLFSGVAFAVLGAIGLFLSNRWLRPLLRHRDGSRLADRRARPPARPAPALCHRAGDLHRMGDGRHRLGHPLAAHGRDLHGGKGASLALRHLGDRRRARHRLRLPGHRASVAAGAAPLTSRPAT